MRKHWRYLLHFLRWKRYVWQAGRKVPAPAWRMVVHDLARLRPSMWRAYTEFLEGPTADAQVWMARWLVKTYGARVLDATAEQEQAATKAYKDAREKVTIAFQYARIAYLHTCRWSWTWWILRDEQKAQPDALEMPESLVRVQVADWIAGVRDQAGKWDPDVLRRFYRYRRDNIKLHHRTRKLVEELLQKVSA